MGLPSLQHFSHSQCASTGLGSPVPMELVCAYIVTTRPSRGAPPVCDNGPPYARQFSRPRCQCAMLPMKSQEAPLHARQHVRPSSSMDGQLIYWGTLVLGKAGTMDTNWHKMYCRLVILTATVTYVDYFANSVTIEPD